MVKEITSSQDFENWVKKAEKGKIVVVDFHAQWCGPCKQIAPQYEELAKEESDVLFFKLDVDELPELVEEQQVEAMPTFAVWKDGVKKKTLTGAQLGPVKAAIQELKA